MYFDALFIQLRGHNLATLDPLGILDADLDDSIPEELVLENWGLSESCIFVTNFNSLKFMDYLKSMNHLKMFKIRK